VAPTTVPATTVIPTTVPPTIASQPTVPATTTAAPAGTDAADASAGATLAVGGQVTGCASVGHIGDSLSVGLESPDFLVDPDDRIDARYRHVGVEQVRVDSSGGRSVVEMVAGQPNAESAARSMLAEGHDGCWVFALGTNDAANRAVGSGYDAWDRIAIMMEIAGDRPVLWVNVRTLRDSGPYADAEMQVFDRALLEACASYPNLRIYDWAGEVDDAWFQDDWIHLTSRGYAEMADRIALALAAAFPASDAPSASCVIRTGG